MTATIIKLFIIINGLIKLWYGMVVPIKDYGNTN